MSEQLVVGSLVIGVGFVLDVEYNDRLGEVVEVLGEMQVKNKIDDRNSETTSCYMVKWVEQDEPDLIRHANLRLVKPDNDKGEQSILNLFKVLPSRYNFDHHKQIREEMEAERTQELEAV
jgi:hypothetical protein